MAACIGLALLSNIVMDEMMVTKMPNRWSWAVAAALQLLLFLPAHASECDSMINEITNLPGVSLANKNTLPSEDGELVNVKFAYAADTKAHIQAECATKGPSYAVLMDVYDAMLPPRSYLETLAKLGSILTRAPVQSIEAAVRECYETAHKAGDHSATLKRNGITFDCDINQSDAGPITVTITAPPAAQ